jgi:hypothetical protein
MLVLEKEISLTLFAMILRITAEFCKQIDPLQSTSTKYMPRKQEIFRIPKNSTNRHDQQLLHVWEYKNSDDDMGVVLLNALHRISSCNSGDALHIICKYEDVNNPGVFQEFPVDVTLPENFFDFGHLINSDVLFQSTNIEYTLETLLDFLNEYVCNGDVIEKVGVILLNFVKARKVFFDSFNNKFKLPDYQFTSDYLDAYFDMVKNLSLLISENGQDLLYFDDVPNLMDIVLNIDGKIDESRDFSLSLFNPFVLNSYFVSAQFLAKQIYDVHFPETPMPLKGDLSYGFNVDIIASKIIDNFKYNFYYRGKRYFAEPLFEIYEQFTIGEIDLPVNYKLQVTKQADMQSYNLIEPMRFYTKISSVLQHDLPNVRDTINIGVFGYISPFTFGIFTHLVANALKKERLKVNKFNFTFYRFNAELSLKPEQKVNSKHEIGGVVFNCEYSSNVFKLNKQNIEKLYEDNNIVFLLDVYDLYKNCPSKEDKFLPNNIKEGLYSQIIDKCAVRRNGSKNGIFENLYKYAEKLNYSRNSSESLNGSPDYVTDTVKMNKFLEVFESELEKKKEDFNTVLFIYNSDNEVSNIYSDKKIVEYCREEFYDKKYIEVLKVSSLSTREREWSCENCEKYNLHVSFWQWTKPISSTLHANMLLLMNKTFMNIKFKTIDKILANFINFMENLYVVIDYDKIGNVKIKFYKTKIPEVFRDNLFGREKSDIAKELLQIISQLLDYCFNYNDKSKFAIPFNYVNFAMLDMEKLFPTMLYSNCKNISDILFKYMATNYRSEVRYILIRKDFEPKEKDFSKAQEDKISYRQRRAHYRLMEVLDAFNYLMIPQFVVDEAKRKGIKNILEEIEATGTTLYKNLIKKS